MTKMEKIPFSIKKVRVSKRDFLRFILTKTLFSGILRISYMKGAVQTLRKLLNKLERKFGKFAIPNLMTIIVFGMALVYLINFFTNPEYTFNLSSLIYFDRELILQGQVWRIFTFVFDPPDSSPLFIIFALYFYWLIGSALERQWGSFRFNVYYLTGMLGAMIAGMITGYATNTYLNMSLFLAFAMLYPNFEVLLFFFIPVKMKFLAWLDVALMLVLMVLGGWVVRIAILVSFLNFLLFFWSDLVGSAKMLFRRIGIKSKKSQKNDKRWKNHWWNDKDNDPFH